MILSFMTGRSGQKVQTQIRLLIRVYTVCNSLRIFWMHYSKEKPSCSTFRVITANFRGSEILGIYGTLITVVALPIILIVATTDTVRLYWVVGTTSARISISLPGKKKPLNCACYASSIWHSIPPCTFNSEVQNCN